MNIDCQSCIVTTNDGSHSLRHPILGELYHSDRGAVGESMHVFIGNGFCYAAERGRSKIAVLEIGFGSGLNAWLTLRQAQEMNIYTDYHTIELYPIDLDTASQLNYTSEESFTAMHLAKFGECVKINDHFTLTKHLCSIPDFRFEDFTERFDVIYYDAFAPEVQPELWSEDIFRRLYVAVSQGGVLTTYTAKGVVKRALRNAGFTVERLKGALGKRHQIRAVKE